MFPVRFFESESYRYREGFLFKWVFFFFFFWLIRMSEPSMSWAPWDLQWKKISESKIFERVNNNIFSNRLEHFKCKNINLKMCLSFSCTKRFATKKVLFKNWLKWKPSLSRLVLLCLGVLRNSAFEWSMLLLIGNNFLISGFN